MTNIAYKALEKQVQTVALMIREELARIEGVHRFNFNIECEGRVDGDIKIEFRIASDYDTGVRGGDIFNSLLECMRRKGWNDTHMPKMISHVTGKVTEAED